MAQLSAGVASGNFRGIACTNKELEECNASCQVCQSGVRAARVVGQTFEVCRAIRFPNLAPTLDCAAGRAQFNMWQFMGEQGVGGWELQYTFQRPYATAVQPGIYALATLTCWCSMHASKQLQPLLPAASPMAAGRLHRLLRLSQVVISSQKSSGHLDALDRSRTPTSVISAAAGHNASNSASALLSSLSSDARRQKGPQKNQRTTQHERITSLSRADRARQYGDQQQHSRSGDDWRQEDGAERDRQSYTRSGLDRRRHDVESAGGKGRGGDSRGSRSRGSVASSRDTSRFQDSPDARGAHHQPLLGSSPAHGDLACLAQCSGLLLLQQPPTLGVALLRDICLSCPDSTPVKHAPAAADSTRGVGAAATTNQASAGEGIRQLRPLRAATAAEAAALRSPQVMLLAGLPHRVIACTQLQGV